MPIDVNDLWYRQPFNKLREVLHTSHLRNAEEYEEGLQGAEPWLLNLTEMFKRPNAASSDALKQGQLVRGSRPTLSAFKSPDKLEVVATVSKHLDLDEVQTALLLQRYVKLHGLKVLPRPTAGLLQELQQLYFEERRGLLACLHYVAVVGSGEGAAGDGRRPESCQHPEVLERLLQRLLRKGLAPGLQRLFERGVQNMRNAGRRQPGAAIDEAAMSGVLAPPGRRAGEGTAPQSGGPVLTGRDALAEWEAQTEQELSAVAGLLLLLPASRHGIGQLQLESLARCILEDLLPICQPLHADPGAAEPGDLLALSSFMATCCLLRTMRLPSSMEPVSNGAADSAGDDALAPLDSGICGRITGLLKSHCRGTGGYPAMDARSVLLLGWATILQGQAAENGPGEAGAAGDVEELTAAAHAMGVLPVLATQLRQPLLLRRGALVQRSCQTVLGLLSDTIQAFSLSTWSTLPAAARNDVAAILVAAMQDRPAVCAWFWRGIAPKLLPGGSAPASDLQALPGKKGKAGGDKLPGLRSFLQDEMLWFPCEGELPALLQLLAASSCGIAASGAALRWLATSMQHLVLVHDAASLPGFARRTDATRCELLTQLTVTRFPGVFLPAGLRGDIQNVLPPSLAAAGEQDGRGGAAQWLPVLWHIPSPPDGLCFALLLQRLLFGVQLIEAAVAGDERSQACLSEPSHLGVLGHILQLLARLTGSGSDGAALMVSLEAQQGLDAIDHLVRTLVMLLSLLLKQRDPLPAELATQLLSMAGDCLEVLAGLAAWAPSRTLAALASTDVLHAPLHDIDDARAAGGDLPRLPHMEEVRRRHELGLGVYPVTRGFLRLAAELCASCCGSAALLCYVKHSLGAVLGCHATWSFQDKRQRWQLAAAALHVARAALKTGLQGGTGARPLLAQRHLASTLAAALDAGLLARGWAGAVPFTGPELDTLPAATAAQEARRQAVVDLASEFLSIVPLLLAAAAAVPSPESRALVAGLVQAPGGSGLPAASRVMSFLQLEELAVPAWHALRALAQAMTGDAELQQAFALCLAPSCAARQAHRGPDKRALAALRCPFALATAEPELFAVAADVLVASLAVHPALAHSFLLPSLLLATDQHALNSAPKATPSAAATPPALPAPPDAKPQEVAAPAAAGKASGTSAELEMPSALDHVWEILQEAAALLVEAPAVLAVALRCILGLLQHQASYSKMVQVLCKQKEFWGRISECVWPAGCPAPPDDLPPSNDAAADQAAAARAACRALAMRILLTEVFHEQVACQEDPAAGIQENGLAAAVAVAAAGPDAAASAGAAGGRRLQAIPERSAPGSGILDVPAPLHPPADAAAVLANLLSRAGEAARASTRRQKLREKSGPAAGSGQRRNTEEEPDGELEDEEMAEAASAAWLLPHLWHHQRMQRLHEALGTRLAALQAAAGLACLKIAEACRAERGAAAAPESTARCGLIASCCAEAEAVLAGAPALERPARLKAAQHAAFSLLEAASHPDPQPERLPGPDDGPACGDLAHRLTAACGLSLLDALVPSPPAGLAETESGRHAACAAAAAAAGAALQHQAAWAGEGLLCSGMEAQSDMPGPVQLVSPAGLSGLLALAAAASDDSCSWPGQAQSLEGEPAAAVEEAEMVRAAAERVNAVAGALWWEVESLVWGGHAWSLLLRRPRGTRGFSAVLDSTETLLGLAVEMERMWALFQRATDQQHELLAEAACRDGSSAMDTLAEAEPPTAEPALHRPADSSGACLPAGDPAMLHPSRPALAAAAFLRDRAAASCARLAETLLQALQAWGLRVAAGAATAASDSRKRVGFAAERGEPADGSCALSAAGWDLTQQVLSSSMQLLQQLPSQAWTCSSGGNQAPGTAPEEGVLPRLGRTLLGQVLQLLAVVHATTAPLIASSAGTLPQEFGTFCAVCMQLLAPLAHIAALPGPHVTAASSCLARALALLLPAGEAVRVSLSARPAVGAVFRDLSRLVQAGHDPSSGSAPTRAQLAAREQEFSRALSQLSFLLAAAQDRRGARLLQVQGLSSSCLSIAGVVLGRMAQLEAHLPSATGGPRAEVLPALRAELGLQQVLWTKLLCLQTVLLKQLGDSAEGIQAAVQYLRLAETRMVASIAHPCILRLRLPSAWLAALDAVPASGAAEKLRAALQVALQRLSPAPPAGGSGPPSGNAPAQDSLAVGLEVPLAHVQEAAASLMLLRVLANHYGIWQAGIPQSPNRVRDAAVRLLQFVALPSTLDSFLSGAAPQPQLLQHLPLRAEASPAPELAGLGPAAVPEALASHGWFRALTLDVPLALGGHSGSKSAAWLAGGVTPLSRSTSPALPTALSSGRSGSVPAAIAAAAAANSPAGASPRAGGRVKLAPFTSTARPAGMARSASGSAAAAAPPAGTRSASPAAGGPAPIASMRSGSPITADASLGSGASGSLSPMSMSLPAASRPALAAVGAPARVPAHDEQRSTAFETALQLYVATLCAMGMLVALTPGSPPWAPVPAPAASGRGAPAAVAPLLQWPSAQDVVAIQEQAAAAGLALSETLSSSSGGGGSAAAATKALPQGLRLARVLLELLRTCTRLLACMGTQQGDSSAAQSALELLLHAHLRSSHDASWSDTPLPGLSALD